MKRLDLKTDFANLYLGWFLSTILFGGVAWELGSLIENGLANVRSISLIKLGALSFSVVFFLLLSTRNFRISVGFLGCTFAGFACYHVFNFGKPCGCLNSSGVSGIPLIVANGALSTLCFIYAAVRQYSTKSAPRVIFACLCSVFGGAVVFLAMSEKQETARLISICDWVRLEQPFELVRPTKEDPLQAKNLELFVINRDCVKCQDFVRNNFPRELLSDFQFSQSKAQLIVHRIENSTWLAFQVVSLDESQETVLRPSRAIVANGLMESCAAID